MACGWWGLLAGLCSFRGRGSGVASWAGWWVSAWPARVVSRVRGCETTRAEETGLRAHARTGCARLGESGAVLARTQSEGSTSEGGEDAARAVIRPARRPSGLGVSPNAGQAALQGRCAGGRSRLGGWPRPPGARGGFFLGSGFTMRSR
jgi:hypothetical protein